jgi:alpha-D-ribose 1-methylphosphonate 5-triphosphate synthase subunit PhnG
MTNLGGNDGARADTGARQQLMRACAEATQAELESAVAALGDLPAVEDIRPPQTGLVMLRGRIGGNGAAFNVGEATVTQAAVRLDTGATGFSYLLGQSHARARLAALLDALGHESATRKKLEAVLVVPVMARRAGENASARAETAATRVDFFTLMRGED